MEPRSLLLLVGLFAACTLCTADSANDVVPETGRIPMALLQESGSAEAPESSPITTEYSVPAEEVQADMEQAMRNQIRSMVSRGTASRIAAGAPALTAVRGAVRDVQAHLSPTLVETTAKGEAIHVAKRHARSAATAAAVSGASVAEQANVARQTASQVAAAFAKVAKARGLHIARDELSIQGDAALRRAEAAAPVTLTGVAAQTHARRDAGQVADSIAAAAKDSVATGIANTKAAAQKVAKEEGLSRSETRKLEGVAADAVKSAATANAPGGAPQGVSAADYATRQNAAADADAFSTAGGDKGRISLDKAAAAAKAKALAAELKRYKAIAAEEKKKARLTLQEAAKAERSAAKLVDNMATKSLARGLDKQLSTKELKHASEEATKASTKVEISVKDAVRHAIRQKERLKRANEKVSKVGDDARREAAEKNEAHRASDYKIKQERERAARAKAKELKRKKARANEAAHKAIVKVVHSAGGKASRHAARLNAAKIQQDFVTAACHRHTQHNLRTISLDAGRALASRGLSKAAQAAGRKKAIVANEKTTIAAVVGDTVRRQAHLAAMGAKQAAASRGLTGAAQLAGARKAWKAAAPKITGFCRPAAAKAAAAEVLQPNKAPEKVNQHAFVVRAVRTMEQAVSKACTNTTNPLVIDGAKLAAKHDADYAWQVAQGKKEVQKVCDAATKLYMRNAEEKSKEMVARSFAESSEAKQKSSEFQEKMRQRAKDKVNRAQTEAASVTSQKMNKQCMVRTTAAVAHAKAVAARNALGEIVQAEAATRAKAAYLKAYNQAVSDGLGTAHAKRLGAEAAHLAHADSQAEVKAATAGLAQGAAATAEEAGLLQGEARAFRATATQARARERVQKRSEVRASPAVAAAVERHAREAEEDARKVGVELQELQASTREGWSADSASAALSTALLGVGVTVSQGQEREHLEAAIAAAVREFHKLGGRLPSERQLGQVQDELERAKAHIAHLEAQATPAKAAADTPPSVLAQ